jgi:ketosteroid isomerase-like protein
MSADAQDIIATIERLQVAVGEDDRARVKELLCQDFHAFENGVRMTGPELLDAMSRYYAEGKRYRWSVNSPQIEVHGDLGAVVYVNYGSIAEAHGAEVNPVSWLETVLLRREDSVWRVAFLHSTRTNAAQSAAQTAVSADSPSASG